MEATNGKFYIWPHMTDYNQNIATLKILHKIPARLCVLGTYETQKNFGSHPQDMYVYIFLSLNICACMCI